MGLSYGGWAVNWLAGAAPERFCAIVSENGVASMSTAHGVSSIGPGYDRAIGYGPVITRQKAAVARPRRCGWRTPSPRRC